MSDLQNLTPANTYKALLQIGDYTDGISGDTGANALQVSDGAGNNTSLALSTDRVGIGNTSPSAELDVSGDVIANEYALDQTGSSSSAVAIHAPATNELAIRTNSTEAMRIDSSGQVGIGTTSPTRTLHLVDDTNDGSGGIKVQNYKPVIELSDSTTNATATTLTQDDTKFTIANNNVDSLTIDSSGNVGIGTTLPSAELDVNGGIASTTLTTSGGIAASSSLSAVGRNTINRQDVSGAWDMQPSLYLRLTPGSQAPASKDYGVVFSNADGIAIHADTTHVGNNTYTPHLVVYSPGTTGGPGRVGINTAAPTAPLEVTSTTGGVIIPRMNTSQRTAVSASNGEMVYDTDLHKFYGYANGSWVALH